ncbi:hypothetical protein HPTD01_272 [Halomonas sp. TD01]|nr:hypothetical protein HPTD01_272 [Halomonas sp. TD01]
MCQGRRCPLASLSHVDEHAVQPPLAAELSHMLNTQQKISQLLP